MRYGSSHIDRREFIAMVSFAAAGLSTGACASGRDDATFAELTAREVLTRIREGALSAERYARYCLGQYEARRQLNCVTWLDKERVLEAARAVDSRRSKGASLGELAGLPMVVKDNIDTVGFPTTAGTESLRQAFPGRDAPIVGRLRDAGAILLGKSNMHELAAGGTSSNAVFGAVRNPYDESRIPGGSSGGTAAAIAARIVPAGLGSDTAGSVRIPAALCGIAGLRPTLPLTEQSLYTGGGIVPMSRDLDTIGPMARTVEDVALLDSAIRGVPMPEAHALRGLRLGAPRKHYWEMLDEGVAQIAEEAVRKLRDAGAEVVDVELPDGFESVGSVFFTLMMHGLRHDLTEYLRENVPGVSVEQLLSGIKSRDVAAGISMAFESNTPVEEIERLRREHRPRLIEAYRAVFSRNGIAALVFPTVPVPAPPIRPEGDGPDDQIEVAGTRLPQVQVLIRNTFPAGAFGAPGLSVPAGMTASRLPVGLELDGLPGEDDRLLSVGMAVERVLGRLPAPQV